MKVLGWTLALPAAYLSLRFGLPSWTGLPIAVALCYWCHNAHEAR